MFEDRLTNYNENGSGFRIKKINYLDLKFTKFKPCKGGSYIPTPYLNHSI